MMSRVYLNEETTSHTIGTNVRTITTSKPSSKSSVFAFGFQLAFMSYLSDKKVGQDVDSKQTNQNGDKGEAEKSPRPKISLLDKDLLNKSADYLRRFTRSTAGEQEDLVENLKAQDYSDYGGDNQHGSE